MDVDETTSDTQRSERGIRRPLSIDEEDNNKSNPSPSSRRARTETEHDYRQYLRQLIPFIRFPLMDGTFFALKVLPLDIMPLSTAAPLVQFLTHRSLPDENVLEKVSFAKRRGAQSVVLTTFVPCGPAELPESLPLIINKGHSTFVKGTLNGEEKFKVKASPRPFPRP